MFFPVGSYTHTFPAPSLGSVMSPGVTAVKTEISAHVFSQWKVQRAACCHLGNPVLENT